MLLLKHLLLDFQLYVEVNFPESKPNLLLQKSAELKFNVVRQQSVLCQVLFPLPNLRSLLNAVIWHANKKEVVEVKEPILVLVKVPEHVKTLHFVGIVNFVFP